MLRVIIIILTDVYHDSPKRTISTEIDADLRIERDCCSDLKNILQQKIPKRNIINQRCMEKQRSGTSSYKFKFHLMI